MGNDLPETLTRFTGEKFVLKDGVYVNNEGLKQMVNSQSITKDKDPRWSPDAGIVVYHPGFGQEFKIVGLQFSAGVYSYQCVAINSSNTNIRVFNESQLQSLDEADKPLEGNEKLPINLATFPNIRDLLLRFLASYPVADKKVRERLEFSINSSRNDGITKQILDERIGDRGSFLGENDFTERMKGRYSEFPWSLVASQIDYTLPIK